MIPNISTVTKNKLLNPKQVGIVLFRNIKQPLNSVCPITLAEFKLGDVVIKLECGHIFAETAIKQWVISQNITCPLCRCGICFEDVFGKKRITRIGKPCGVCSDYSAVDDVYEEVIVRRCLQCPQIYVIERT